MKTLYVTDRAAAGDERWRRTLEALRGAPGLSVQLREKTSPDRATLARAREAREKLGPRIPFWVNRRFDVALAAGADGVHLPSDGLPVSRVRANTPRGFRVGVSTHSASEAIAALEEGADLVILGPIFATPSKRGLGEPLGPTALWELPPVSEHGREVYVIGGVTEENAARLLPWRDRITGVAAIRMFQESADPAAVARRVAAL